MKRLEIKGFISLADKMISDKFRIDDMDILKDLYIIQLRTSEYQYRIDIIREATENTTYGGYRYQMWIYDWNRKQSYPMGINTSDLKEVRVFTRFLENVVAIADKGDFGGQNGDWRFKKHNL